MEIDLFQLPLPLDAVAQIRSVNVTNDNIYEMTCANQGTCICQCNTGHNVLFGWDVQILEGFGTRFDWH